MNMINDIFIARTPNGSLYYTANIKTTDIYNIHKYIDTTRFKELCKIGCINYGNKWSCPPYAPSFMDFTKNYRHISICLLTINLNQFSYINNDYLKVKAANVILKSRIDRTLRKLKNEYNHYISTGSCRLCKPCKCKISEKCAHPFLRTYSFEALGIDVSRMAKDFFDYDLLWYKKNHLPPYTCVVAGLLCNQIINELQILEILRMQN